MQTSLIERCPSRALAPCGLAPRPWAPYLLVYLALVCGACNLWAQEIPTPAYPQVVTKSVSPTEDTTRPGQSPFRVLYTSPIVDDSGWERDGSDQDLSKRVEALEKALAEVNREKEERAKQEAEAKEKATQEKAETERQKSDLTDVSHQKWTTKIGGQVMFDYFNWADASPAIRRNAQDVANWRRIRLNVDGNGYGVYDFRVQLDFEPDNDNSNGVSEPYVAMKDVYLSINELPLNGRLRFGNFFVPFSLDQVTPLPNTTFMERAIPTSDIFSPSREVGMASYHISDDLNKTLALGVFFDDIPESTKEVIDDNQGLRLSARATWLPYYDEPSNGRYLIHSGLGFVHTDPRDDLIRFRARGGEYRETQRLIDSGNIAANSYSVANLELATVTGPLSFQSELYATAVDRISATDVTLYGAYVQASYFLTGENRRYNRDGRHLAHFGRVRPLTNFFLVPGGAGWGAWEAKARWSYLDFGALDRGRYNEMTVGMNWHWNEHAQVMLEWTRPWTSAEATVGNTVIGATEADLLAFRLQFTF